MGRAPVTRLPSTQARATMSRECLPPRMSRRMRCRRKWTIADAPRSRATEPIVHSWPSPPRPLFQRAPRSRPWLPFACWQGPAALRGSISILRRRLINGAQGMARVSAELLANERIRGDASPWETAFCSQLWLLSYRQLSCFLLEYI